MLRRNALGPLVASVAVTALLSGCLQNVNRFLKPDIFAVPAGQTGQLATVDYASGLPDEPPVPFALVDTEVIDGISYGSPPLISDRGWVHIHARPTADVRLWIRHTGLTTSGFLPVHEVSGTLPGRVHTGVAFLDDQITPTWTLPMSSLTNVYNGYAFDDGDLLMVEVTEPGEVERYVFKLREFGLRVKGGAGVLFRVPAPGQPAPAVGLSPALALTLAFGYRFRSRQPLIRWLGNRLAVVGSLGIGSTAIADVAAGAGVEDQLDSAFNAALAGGGLELYDFLSVQALANASALFRDVDTEHSWTLAIGFDAVQFARFTRHAGARLFRQNHLDPDTAPP